jgi:D-proline reductase (dithiol) PrdB
MDKGEKRVDGYRFIPPSLAAWMRTFIPEDFKGPIPWKPMEKPLTQVSFAIVTSAGMSLKTDPPFDMEREKREATWGDPSYRAIPRETEEGDIQVHHLHINTSYLLQEHECAPSSVVWLSWKERIIRLLPPTLSMVSMARNKF